MKQCFFGNWLCIIVHVGSVILHWNTPAIWHVFHNNVQGFFIIIICIKRLNNLLNIYKNYYLREEGKP